METKGVMALLHTRLPEIDFRHFRNSIRSQQMQLEAWLFFGGISMCTSFDEVVSSVKIEVPPARIDLSTATSSETINFTL
jgi:hypothetical protein